MTTKQWWFEGIAIAAAVGIKPPLRHIPDLANTLITPDLDDMDDKFIRVYALVQQECPGDFPQTVARSNSCLGAGRLQFTTGKSNYSD